MKAGNTRAVGFQRGRDHRDPRGPQAQLHTGVDLQSPLQEGWVRQGEWREQGSSGTGAGRAGRRAYGGRLADRPTPRECGGGTGECAGQLTEGPGVEAKELASCQWEAARRSA